MNDAEPIKILCLIRLKIKEASVDPNLGGWIMLRRAWESCYSSNGRRRFRRM